MPFLSVRVASHSVFSARNIVLSLNRPLGEQGVLSQSWGVASLFRKIAIASFSGPRKPAGAIAQPSAPQCIEPCLYLIEAIPEAPRRCANPDPYRKTALGVANGPPCRDHHAASRISHRLGR